MRSPIVLSDWSAVGTYLALLKEPPAEAARFKGLPLQSPGVCAYLAVKGKPSSMYLRFKLDEGNRRCRLLIHPKAILRKSSGDDWSEARLLAPMDYREAQRLGHDAQLEYLDRLLDEEWWRQGFSDVRVLAKRTPRMWSWDFNLYQDSMNPVMTAAFMRQGRIPHRSPYVSGLYLAGSSTHPGQWISFCMMSGIHAADCIVKDQSRGAGK